MSNCPDCQQSANAAASAVPNFALTGFDNTAQEATRNVALEGVHALKLQACVSATYTPANNQICFHVPIYGNFCVTSPVSIPIGASLSACVATCGSIIPTGLKVTVNVNSNPIFTKVLFGNC